MMALAVVHEDSLLPRSAIASAIKGYVGTHEGNDLALAADFMFRFATAMHSLLSRPLGDGSDAESSEARSASSSHSSPPPSSRFSVLKSPSAKPPFIGDRKPPSVFSVTSSIPPRSKQVGGGSPRGRSPSSPSSPPDSPKRGRTRSPPPRPVSPPRSPPSPRPTPLPSKPTPAPPPPPPPASPAPTLFSRLRARLTDASAAPASLAQPSSPSPSTPPPPALPGSPHPSSAPPLLSRADLGLGGPRVGTLARSSSLAWLRGAPCVYCCRTPTRWYIGRRPPAVTDGILWPF